LKKLAKEELLEKCQTWRRPRISSIRGKMETMKPIRARLNL
jgi:hypothetical protein